MMKPSYTDIAKFLRSCFFNPRKPGPLSIISDIGNATYYETRAIELIKEATELPCSYENNIVKAIQLLALAREVRYNETQNNNEEKKT